METLFEYRQRDSSWGDRVEIVEFKIFENGELFYHIDIEGRYMTNETKAANAEFAQCIKDFVERKLRIYKDFPSKLENDNGLIKSEFVKIGNKKIFGHDWQRNFDYTDLSEEGQNEDCLVQDIGVLKNFIEKFYPGFIAWSEVGDDWFRDEPQSSNYELDGKYYLLVDNEKIFSEENFPYREVKNITPEQLEMYGVCTDPSAIELKIKSIKKFKSPEWKALISGDDGAGVEISFWDKRYFDHPENYEIGRVGLYKLWASIESEPAAESYDLGLPIEEDDELDYDDFICINNGLLFSDYADLAFFEKTDDFATSGKYKFRTVVRHIMFSADDLDSPIFGFQMPLMNQVDKETPRRVQAQFDLEKPFRGTLEEGMGLSGVLYFSGSKACGKNICRYGDNKSLPLKEKYPDTREWDDDDDDDDE